MAWHKFLAAGLVISVAMVGCTVTTSSDKGGDGGDDGTGGRTGETDGGSGGKSTGGKSGSGGGKATGGAGGATADAKADNGCTICLKTKCKNDYAACVAEPACGGTSTKAGELVNIQSCIFAQLGDAGTGVIDIAKCAGANADDGVAVAAETTDLLTCIRGSGVSDASVQPCSVECFGDLVPEN